MTRDRDPRRALVARSIGWTDERASTHALRGLPRNVATLGVQGRPLLDEQGGCLPSERGRGRPCLR
jgi:hypothetical protein